MEWPFSDKASACYWPRLPGLVDIFYEHISIQCRTALLKGDCAGCLRPKFMTRITKQKQWASAGNITEAFSKGKAAPGKLEPKQLWKVNRRVITFILNPCAKFWALSWVFFLLRESVHCHTRICHIMPIITAKTQNVKLNWMGDDFGEGSRSIFRKTKGAPT